MYQNLSMLVIKKEIEKKSIYYFIPYTIKCMKLMCLCATF